MVVEDMTEEKKYFILGKVSRQDDISSVELSGGGNN